MKNGLHHYFMHRCTLLGNEKHGFEVADVKKEHELQSDLVVLGSTHYNSHIFIIFKYI